MLLAMSLLLASARVPKRRSDPICNSEGCTQYLHPKGKDKYPINYSVPDFGVDHDIITTQSNTIQESSLDNAGEFDPNKIAPEAYETEFELEPIWERQAK